MAHYFQAKFHGQRYILSLFPKNCSIIFKFFHLSNNEEQFHSQKGAFSSKPPQFSSKSASSFLPQFSPEKSTICMTSNWKFPTKQLAASTLHALIKQISLKNQSYYVYFPPASQSPLFCFTRPLSYFIQLHNTDGIDSFSTTTSFSAFKIKAVKRIKSEITACFPIKKRNSLFGLLAVVNHSPSNSLCMMMSFSSVASKLRTIGSFPIPPIFSQNQISFSPKLNMFVLFHKQTIAIFNVSTGKKCASIAPFPYIPIALVFSQNGKYIAVAYPNRFILIFLFLPQSNSFFNLVQFQSEIVPRCLEFSNQANILYIGDSYGRFKGYNVETGQIYINLPHLCNFTKDEGNHQSQSFSSSLPIQSSQAIFFGITRIIVDKTTENVYVCSQDKKVRIIEFETQKVVKILDKFHSPVVDIAFSRDSVSPSKLSSTTTLSPINMFTFFSCEDGSVHIYFNQEEDETKQLFLFQEIIAHQARVNGTIPLDDKTILSFSDDTTFVIHQISLSKDQPNLFESPFSSPFP